VAWRLRDVVEDGDVLVGHSMGGFAISLAADEVPDKIGRLISPPPSPSKGKR
jgi:pimeloyl-ACP methyl ester carboxylesterase